MFSNLNIKKVVFWLFIIMGISFLIAGSILATYGVDKTLISHSGKSIRQDIDVEKTAALGTTTNEPGAGSEKTTNSSQGINQEKSSASEGIKTIDISTVSTNIHIIPVDSNEVKAHFYGSITAAPDNLPELFTEVKGSKLLIEVKQKIKMNIGFNIENSNLKLDISIPRSYAEDLTISTVSGELSVNGFNLNKFHFNSISGNLTAASLNTKESNLSTTSGSMSLKGFTGNLDFQSVSGDLDAAYSSFNNQIEIHSTSGKSTLRLPANSEFNVSFKSVSGNLKSNFPVTTQDNPGSHKSEANVGSSNNRIIIDTVSGDADISE